MDYKDTLFLPQTDFKMRGNLGEAEPIRQNIWSSSELFKKRLLLNKKKTTFFLHDGPPYANNDIHAGHALNKILKDFIVRYKNMNGYMADYIPGWDTHGLPIEVELKKQKITPQNTNLVEFRQKCHEYALSQVARQKEQFLRLGVLGKFDTPYLTLNKDYEADEIEVFAKLVEKGLIYQGLKPVYWSYANKTALAEAEIIYKDVTTNSIYCAFDLIDQNYPNTKLVIWTTTPWTLPANLAVSVNPNFEYGIYKTSKGNFLVLIELAAKLFEILDIKKYELIATIKGKDLENIKYKHPLFDKDCPIILGEHVLATDGTGLVHTAPGHGLEDYVVGIKYNLEPFSPIDEEAKLTSEAGAFAGLFYEDANEEIIKYLENKKSLLKVAPITHSYPHDWRSHMPVIFRSTPQWFCNINSILPNIKQALSSVKFIPNWGKERLTQRMENRTDWCISRQRSWGVPIPILYNSKKEPILDSKVILALAAKIRKYGSSYYYEKEAKELLDPKFTKKYDITSKEVDTLDVWFDSGTSFRSSPYEIDLYIEGLDQYRGWFNSSLVNSVGFNNKAPYKEVISHGFITDSNGQKMSKSLGNVVNPVDVCKSLGADVLRLWVASVDYKNDVNLSTELLNQISEGYRKIRNTIRFLLGSLNGFNYKKEYIEYSMRSKLDKIITIKLNQLVKDVINHYQNYEFEKVYRTILSYIINTLSQFYLDASKDTIYILNKTDHKRKSVLSVIYDNLLTLLKLLTPIIPHTTSEAYEFFPNKEASDIYLLDFPKIRDNFPNEAELLSNYDKFLTVRAEVLKALEVARTNNKLKKSLEGILNLVLPNEFIEAINSLELDLNDTLMVAGVNITKGEEIMVEVAISDGKPCARCWNYHQELDSNGLCKRCSSILEERKK